MEAIINKIKALLNKTEENGATKEEALSALNKAKELKQKYDIDNDRLKDVEITQETVKCNLSNAIKQLFVSELSAIFDCIATGNHQQINFFGYKEDAQIAAFFYTTLTKICEKELKYYRKSDYYIKAVHYKKGLAKTLSVSFRKGFYLQVSLRLSEIYKHKKNDAKNSNEYGIVLANKIEKVKKEHKKVYTETRAHRRQTHNVEANAFLSGKEKGEKATLQQAVKQTTN